MAWNSVGMVLEWCWSDLEWLGIVLEGVRGCWSSVGAAWKRWSELEGWLGVAWNSVGVDWRVLEWCWTWNSVGGC